jgi:glycosyltransferase involved in cell wall biosynthesis
MARRGWQVLVVTADVMGPGVMPEDEGVQVLRLPACRVLQRRVPVPMPSTKLAALYLALRSAPPDLIVSNTRFFPTSLLAVEVARRIGCPLLHIEHGSAAVTLDRPAFDVALGIADRLIGTHVLHRAERCLGVSQATARFLGSEFSVSPVGILSNGVETSGWDHATTDFRRHLGVGEDDILIVYVGRLIEAKGLLDLLHVFSRMEDGPGTRLRLVVAGDGPLARDVEREQHGDPRIAFLGPLDESGSHDLLVAADILAHPSAYPEGLPTVVLEGAAARTAMVATPAGGTTELIDAGESGLIVPAGDRGALRDALALLASDPALRTRLGEAARRSVEERFDWGNITDALEREVLALLEGSDSPACCHRKSRAV